MSSVKKNNKFKRITNIITFFHKNRRKTAVEDLAVKPVTQFPVEIDNEVSIFFYILHYNRQKYTSFE